MAKILSLANLNCDKIININEQLISGNRHYYSESSYRFGGGGANTGIALILAGHEVASLTGLGDDDTGDWIIANANKYGLDCRLVERLPAETQQLLLIKDATGERTIIRPQLQPYHLNLTCLDKQWDAAYINTHCLSATQIAEVLLQRNCLVMAQYNQYLPQVPCNILIAAKNDLPTVCDPWQFAKQYAGSQVSLLIVTEGARGASAFTAEQRYHQPSIEDAQIVDTTGAGDVFAAGFLHHALNHDPIEKALLEASKWSWHQIQDDSSIPGDKLRSYLTAPATKATS